jgi:hypothetical protein
MANRGPLSSAPQIDDKDLPANFRTKEHVLVLPSSYPGVLETIYRPNALKMCFRIFGSSADRILRAP